MKYTFIAGFNFVSFAAPCIPLIIRALNYSWTFLLGMACMFGAIFFMSFIPDDNASDHPTSYRGETCTEVDALELADSESYQHDHKNVGLPRVPR